MMRIRTYMQEKRGFTVLLAALIAAVVLALGSSIFSIAQKQIALSTIGRESQYAFFAVDTALECVLYWDFRHKVFDSSPLVPRTCDGQTWKTFSGSNGIELVSGSIGVPPYTLRFRINNLLPSTERPLGYCAEIVVQKRTSAPFTIITADGYNADCARLSNNNRLIQRTFKLYY